jgi:hypothetical protein
MSLDAIFLQDAPLLAGRVPADQVYAPLGSGPAPPVPPGLAGQVKIVSPTPGQVFSTNSGSVLVTFEPAWPDEPPKGSVKMQWQQQSSRGGWEAHSAVSNAASYKQAQAIPIATYFKQPGDYRLRASAKQDGWTGWREFHIANAVTVMGEINDLSRRLGRQRNDPDAARLLVEVKALQTRLASQPSDVDAVLPRLNELKREVRQVEIVPRRPTPPRRSGAEVPAGKTP